MEGRIYLDTREHQKRKNVIQIKEKSNTKKYTKIIEKKCENAPICSAKAKLICNFRKHHSRDDYAPCNSGFVISVEILSF